MIEISCEKAILHEVEDTKKIGIDGIDGVGKSTLAGTLANHLGVDHIDIDNYLDKNHGGYLQYLDYKSLETDLAKANGFVLEGVCLLAVIEIIDTKLDTLIYIKRMAHGLWANERECNISGDVNEFIESERDVVNLISGSSDNEESLGLAEEVIRYHDKYRPHEKVDIIFQRNDC